MNIVSSIQGIPCCNPPSFLRLLKLPRSIAAGSNNLITKKTTTRCSSLPALLAAAVLLSSPAPPEETLSNIPQTLSGERRPSLLQPAVAFGRTLCWQSQETTPSKHGSSGHALEKPSLAPLNALQLVSVAALVLREKAHSISGDHLLFSSKDLEAANTAWWSAQTFAISSKMEIMDLEEKLTFLVYDSNRKQ